MAKLKPRARLIRTIGDKLISGPEAAIIELVKNAYDADSPSVEITIYPPSLDDSGKITIRDFGHGMTYKNILNDWLEPATDTKTKNSLSKSGNRIVLGAKGVGRFASARLGKTISLTSVAKLDDAYQKSSLKLDWGIFESNTYLDDIDIDIDKTELKSADNTGVTIQITDLSTIWDKKKVQKLIRELRRLATPQTDQSTQFDIHLDLQHFTENNPEPYNFNGQQLLLESNSTGDVVEESQTNNETLITPYRISKESDYHLVGAFDPDGKFTGTFTIVRGDNQPIQLNLDAPPLEIGELSCGPIRVDLKLYDLEKDSANSTPKCTTL